MKNAATLPYDWLKEIPTSLLQLDSIPLLGYPPSFPWEEFTTKLAATFQLKDLKIKPLGVEWRTADDLLNGLGGSPIAIHISIPGLEGDVCWLFPENDIKYLLSLLITQKEQPLDLLDPEFEKGFTQFLIYEVFHVFNQCNFDNTLNPHLLEEGAIPTEPALCQDISIALNGRVFVGRLIFSPAFQKSWKERYAVRTLDIPMESVLAQKIEIPVHIVAGETALTLGEWKQIQLGDFITLDYCSLDPTSDKGRITLTVNGQPFFRGRLKEGSIKILEHPLYYEAEAHMTPQDEPKEEQEEEFEEEFESEEKTMSEESFDSESDEAVEALLSQAEKVIQKAPKEDKQEVTQAAKTPLKPEEIPLSIVVEVGRLQMSVQKLLELQPGNLLELDIRPEMGVDLVVNGRRIGKGELLRVGEVLGVRVLDIG